MTSSENSDRDARRPEKTRADRLAKALQANLGRRKAQARGRGAQDGRKPDAESDPATAPINKDTP
jgi:hypothetical protein